MHIIDKTITIDTLKQQYLSYFKTLVKAVVDVEKKIIALDAELHSDLEAYLLERDSKQENLWGINLYPFNSKEDFIEYTSLINIRPHQDNPSMEIVDQHILKKVKAIVEEYISYES